MTNIFSVIGENRDDPTRLLVLGDDGQPYQFLLPDGPPTPVEITDDWTVDPNSLQLDDLFA